MRQQLLVGVGGVIYLILEGGSVTMFLALILTLTTLALSATARTALSESDHQPHALLSSSTPSFLLCVGGGGGNETATRRPVVTC